jgi:hypothetical protein
MSDSLKAKKIVLLVGLASASVGLVKLFPLIPLEKFSAIGKISGTLAGFSAPWLLPALGIFTLVGADRHERRDFRGSSSGGFFNGSVKTGNVIAGNPGLGGWLATYWLMVYPIVMFYYSYIRIPFEQSIHRLLGISDSTFAIITVLNMLAEFLPVVIAVIVAGKVWHSGSGFCRAIIATWMLMILAAAGNLVIYCGLYLAIKGL